MLQEQLLSTPRPLADRAIDALMRRARFLLPTDQALLDLVLVRQLPVYAIAKLRGLHPGTTARHVKKLIRRLQQPMVIALIDRGRQQLPEELWQVGIAYFVQRQSMARIADLHQITLYRVRVMLDQVRGWAKAHHRSL